MTAFSSESSFSRAPQQGQETSKSILGHCIARSNSRRSKVEDRIPADFRRSTLRLFDRPCLGAFQANSAAALLFVWPAPFVLRREHPIETPRFQRFGRSGRRDVLVEQACLGLRDRPLGQSAYDELAPR